MAKIKKREISPDPKFENVKVAKFINHVMKKGKKTTARKIVYEAFDTIKKKTKQDPLDIFEKAIRNVAPKMEVRSRRVGGANYQVPYRVPQERGHTLAIRWIIRGAKGGKGKDMSERLANELLDASRKQGEAIRRRENVHRMAEANKAFAHLAR